MVWVKDRNHVRCTYWSSKTKKWRITSRPIDFDSDMDDDKKQEVVNIEAIALQQYFKANHNRAGDLACLTGSAESALDEPRRKASKTEVSAESCSSAGERLDPEVSTGSASHDQRASD